MEKNVMISNPPSGFTVTFDQDVTDILGGLYNHIAVKASSVHGIDDEVRVRIFPCESSKHKVVLRSSSNRYSTTRMVDRFEKLKPIFPYEFGPTYVPYEITDNGKVVFWVPKLAKLKKPISRLRKETKVPYFKPTVKEPSTSFLLIKELLSKDVELSEEVYDYLKQEML